MGHSELSVHLATNSPESLLFSCLFSQWCLTRITLKNRLCLPFEASDRFVCYLVNRYKFFFGISCLILNSILFCWIHTRCISTMLYVKSTLKDDRWELATIHCIFSMEFCLLHTSRQAVFQLHHKCREFNNNKIVHIDLGNILTPP